MAPSAKPRHRSGYRPDDTEQVKSACLTVAVTLGTLMDDLCIVGGCVPSLLIDHQVGPDPGTGDLHSGTNDLDIGLASTDVGKTRWRSSRCHPARSPAGRHALSPDENVLYLAALAGSRGSVAARLPG